jgi:hypothetical protein
VRSGVQPITWGFVGNSPKKSEIPPQGLPRTGRYGKGQDCRASLRRLAPVLTTYAAPPRRGVARLGWRYHSTQAGRVGVHSLDPCLVGCVSRCFYRGLTRLKCPPNQAGGARPRNLTPCLVGRAGPIPPGLARLRILWGWQVGSSLGLRNVHSRRPGADQRANRRAFSRLRALTSALHGLRPSPPCRCSNVTSRGMTWLASLMCVLGHRGW